MIPLACMLMLTSVNSRSNEIAKIEDRIFSMNQSHACKGVWSSLERKLTIQANSGVRL